MSESVNTTLATLLDSAVTPISPSEYRWRIGPHEGLAGSREDARAAVERWGTRREAERRVVDRLKGEDA